MKKIVCLLAVLSFLLVGCGTKYDFVISNDEVQTTEDTTLSKDRIPVLINKNSMTYHLDFSCIYASRMSEENRMETDIGSLAYLEERGYHACSRCAEPKEPK